jgi:hypothetical protein
MSDNNLKWIQKWYLKQTDGEWEHSFGIKIDTLDDPGWSVSIDLEDTDLSKEKFASVDIEKSESDWIRCEVEMGKFMINCGPLNLDEALGLFRNWVESRA